MYWYEDLMEAEDYMAYYSAHPFENVFTSANLLYLLSMGVYFSVMYLIGLFYFVLHVCDLRQVSVSKAPGIYFTRIWWLVLYSASVLVPALILFSVFPFAFMVMIPAFYARPGLVMFDKKDAYTATMLSSVKTRGHKLSIFVELSIISLLYTILHVIVYNVLNSGSIGFCLVESFLRGYFALVLARNMSMRFHMITVFHEE
ncbi:MAG: hypothetical protein J5379_05945 [Clostridiales bacterium]|nr:hypothetical protein [Clostridiales bacterium]